MSDVSVSDNSTLDPNLSSTGQGDTPGGSAGSGVDDQISPRDPPEEIPEVFLTPEEQAYLALSKQHEESLASVEKLQGLLHAERLKNVQLENQLAKGLN